MTKGIKNKLNKLRRLALTLVGHVRKSTPETGLDVVLGQTPLDLAVLEQAILARLRTKSKSMTDWNGKGTRKRKSHFLTLDEIIEEQGLTNCIDDQATHLEWTKDYTVNVDSFEAGQDIEHGTRLYTDGSKMGENT